MLVLMVIWLIGVRLWREAVLEWRMRRVACIAGG
jgi:hypothetical protein